MNVARIHAVAAKELRELSRDPITMLVCLLMPFVMLFLYGYAVSLDVDNVHLGVWDLDRSPASRSLVDGFVRSGYFRLQRSFSSSDELSAALQAGEVKVAIVIPERFSAAFATGQQPQVQVIVDGTFSDTAAIIAGYADAIVRRFGFPSPEVIRAEIRAWYNPEMRSANYIIPGLFGVILMAFPPLLTALAIVREKETGSIQQIFASPLTSAEFIIGKVIPYSMIAYLQLVAVVAVGVAWFDVPFRGDVGVLLAVGIIFVFCTVGLGLLVSTITRSQLVAMLLALILTMMPSILFSGFLFPIFTMPVPLQIYTYMFPARFFVDLSRDLVMKGAGAAELWPNAAMLMLYTAAVFTLAALRFRKKVA